MGGDAPIMTLTFDTVQRKLDKRRHPISTFEDKCAAILLPRITRISVQSH